VSELPETRLTGVDDLDIPYEVAGPAALDEADLTGAREEAQGMLRRAALSYAASDDD